MPAVRESDGETPATLEVVEVRPGVRLKLNAADKKAHAAAAREEQERSRRWNLINSGTADKPAKETVIAGADLDGGDAEQADADEQAVAAAPKPRTRKK